MKDNKTLIITVMAVLLLTATVTTFFFGYHYSKTRGCQQQVIELEHELKTLKTRYESSPDTVIVRDTIYEPVRVAARHPRITKSEPVLTPEYDPDVIEYDLFITEYTDKYASMKDSVWVDGELIDVVREVEYNLPTREVETIIRDTVTQIVETEKPITLPREDKLVLGIGYSVMQNTQSVMFSQPIANVGWSFKDRHQFLLSKGLTDLTSFNVSYNLTIPIRRKNE